MRRKPDAAYKMIDGEAMIVLPGKGVVHVLNPSGSLIWDLLDGSRNLDSIIARVCEEFEVDPETAGSDARQFLQELEKFQMVAEV